MILQLFLARTLGFPLWWYGRGLRDFIGWFSRSISQFSKSVALRVWMKNLFVPMYGDTSFAGRAISFFIRLVMIFFRGAGVVLYTILLAMLFFVYLLLPPVVLIGLVYNAQAFL